MEACVPTYVGSERDPQSPAGLRVFAWSGHTIYPQVPIHDPRCISLPSLAGVRARGYDIIAAVAFLRDTTQKVNNGQANALPWADANCD
jgi:hypothetical protein